MPQWGRTPKATTRPTYGDIRQAAGFLEGEGSFLYASTPKVAGYQKDPEYLVVLQRMFGGRVHQPQWTSKPEKIVWRWDISGSRAAGAMMTLYQFMSTRRKESIRQALDQWRQSPGRWPQARAA